MKKQSDVFSIFGQINVVVAEAMIAEGKATRIEPGDIPPTARWNDAGEEAHCAIVLSNEASREFDRRVRDLMA